MIWSLPSYTQDFDHIYTQVGIPMTSQPSCCPYCTATYRVFFLSYWPGSGHPSLLSFNWRPHLLFSSDLFCLLAATSGNQKGKHKHHLLLCLDRQIPFWGSCPGSSLLCMGSPVMTWGLSCPKTCQILVPWPGMEPASPVSQGGFLTTGPPGKSPDILFDVCS